MWDRFRDRSFWLTQKAVRNVRDQADVVLYLVNASEEPSDAGYLAPELAVLEWIGKPVIVLLNQTGPPRAYADELADETRWRDALAQWTHVRELLTFDAFARCWVQEFTLFAAVARVLPEARRPTFDRLVAAWKARRMTQFADSMARARRTHRSRGLRRGGVAGRVADHQAPQVAWTRAVGGREPRRACRNGNERAPGSRSPGKH